MVAVVDDKAQGLVGVGSAASSGGLRRLMHDHLKSGLGEPHSGAQAGDARSHDMDGPAPHRTP